MAGKKIIFYLGVIIIPLLIFLVSGEIMMRFLVPHEKVPDPPKPSVIDPYKPNPYIVQTKPFFYYHIPKAVYTQSRSYYKVKYEINTRGFRGPEIIVPKAKGVKRLLVIGDSIVEGHGVDFTKTFSLLLNEHVRSSGWEVINVGVQGASPIYFAANAERYLALQPDAVLIMTFENDIREDRLREDSYFDLPYLDDADTILQPQLKRKIITASYLYNGLRRILRTFTLSPLEKIISLNREVIATNKEVRATLAPGSFLIKPSSIAQQWSMSRKYLDYLVARLREKNTQVLVTNLSIKSIRPKLGSSFHTYAQTVNEYVAAWAKENELPFFSLLPVIRQTLKEKKIAEVTIKGDGHPTNSTHSIIEAALRPWVLQNLNHQE